MQTFSNHWKKIAMACALWLPMTAFTPLPRDAQAEDAELWPVTAVPERLNLSDFYKKHVSVRGFPVVASGNVADAALREAAHLIDRMVTDRPDILRALVENHVRFTVMGVDEFTTDVPEHADLRPRDYWDRRARGLGATRRRPSVSCGEENLLRYPGDPYAAENILIHEFGHAMHEMGLNTVDESFDDRLRATFEAAMNAGLWKGKYAATNKQEYWAEGVQSWFDTNRPPDHDHNHVDTRDELKEYDPRLAKLLGEVFGDGSWRYTRPALRREAPHLAGWNPERNPRFEWPADIVARYEAFQSASRGERLAGESAAWRDAPSIALTQLDESQSARSTTSATLLIVNQTKDAVRLHWIDEQGHRRSRGRIRAGGYELMETYVGHLFLATDAENQPVALFRAGGKRQRALIKSPSVDE